MHSTSIFLAKNCIKTDIIAFESIPYLCELFKENYSLYVGEMRNKITLENMKLYQKVSQVIDNREDNNITQVKSIALDDYKFPNHKKISVIKINLEGNELEILKGMINIIKHHQPVLIFHNLDPLINSLLNKKNDIKNIIKFLNDLNYKVDRFSGCNYIAVTNDM